MIFLPVITSLAIFSFCSDVPNFNNIGSDISPDKKQLYINLNNLFTLHKNLLLIYKLKYRFHIYLLIFNKKINSFRHEILNHEKHQNPLKIFC
jgi:hypothetical protein